MFIVKVFTCGPLPPLSVQLIIPLLGLQSLYPLSLSCVRHLRLCPLSQKVKSINLPTYLVVGTERCYASATVRQLIVGSGRTFSKILLRD